MVRQKLWNFKIIFFEEESVVEISQQGTGHYLFMFYRVAIAVFSRNVE